MVYGCNPLSSAKSKTAPLGRQSSCQAGGRLSGKPTSQLEARLIIGRQAHLCNTVPLVQGSMARNREFAAAAFADVSALNIVDSSTSGSPTIPHASAMAVRLWPGQASAPMPARHSPTS